MMVTEIISGSTAVVVFGGLAFLGFRWLLRKWLDNHFAQQLEEFKREQSELLEEYRLEINSEFNRISKIHEKEFEVLPEIWGRIQSSYTGFVFVAAPM